MKKITIFLAFLLIPAAVFSQQWGSRSQALEVQLHSFMPANSEWGRTLNQIAGEWARITNNEVRLRVRHNVQAGDAQMLSSLSTNTIQAALFTSFGLTEISPSIMTLSIPFLIKDDMELNLVLNEILPVLEKQVLDSRINRTNFVVLAWSKGGWVNVFSKEPVLTPDDLRRHKLATNPESMDMNAAFKGMGFQLVDVDMTELGPKLASNAINACYQLPAAVAPQYYEMRKYLGNMLGKPIAPFLGAIVVNGVTWNKLSPERQQELMRVTRRIAADFDSTMSKTMNDAVGMMQKGGLKVNLPNMAQEEQWRAELQKMMPSLVGTAFDRDMYQKINEILDKARRQ